LAGDFGGTSDWSQAADSTAKGFPEGVLLKEITQSEMIYFSYETF